MNAVGVSRRLQAFAAIGHPDEDVAGWLGVDVAVVRDLQRDGACDEALAGTVAAVYEQFATTPGRCRATRLQARLGGWVTDLTWDDIDHDTTPQSVRRPTVWRQQCWSAPRSARVADYQARATVSVAQATKDLLTSLIELGLGFRDIAVVLQVPVEDVAMQCRLLTA